MSWWKWSKTAASNATADPTINWAEGMSPGAVNDSSRAEMAGSAKYFADQDGSIVTTGTLTAYALTTNGGFDSLAHLDGRKLCFTPHTTNGATVTLAVDGLGAKPLRYGPSLELQSGMLIQGTPYNITYNNSDAAFYLHDIGGDPYGIPLGGMMPYIGSSAPNTAFVLPFGQAISRTTYAKLFALVGTTFGGGDGTTTFNIPDLRGRAVFGLDNMGGSAASRIGSVSTDGGTVVGTTVGSAGGSSTHVQTVSEMVSHTHDANTSGGDVATWGGNVTGGGGPGPTNAPASSNMTHVPAVAFASAKGGSAAMSLLPPCLILPFILRVI